MFVCVVELLSCSISCLASNLLSTDIGADTNIGRMSPSHGGGGNSVGTVAGNVGIGNWRGNNVVVSGGQWRGNSIGGSKRSNNIGGSKGWDSVVDKSWVSLSISLTLDNVLNGTVLGNIRWSIDTVGHS